MRFGIGKLRWMCVVLALLLLAGCTLPADRAGFEVGPADAGAVDAETVDARELLEAAIEASTTSEAVRSFWYNGHVKNSLQLHEITSMYEGVMSRDIPAYIVNARIAGQPYKYYNYDGVRYLNRHDRWYPVDSDDSLPFDPMFGFADWLPLMEQAVKKKDADVLGRMNDVIEVKLNALEWVQRSPSALFADLQEELGLDDEPELKRILQNTTVKMTLWIGKEDRIITQYQTWIIMPLPGGGYFDQEVFFRFFHFNDPSIESKHIPKPEKIQDWVTKYEESIKLQEEQL